jgi:hypothetical protein
MAPRLFKAVFVGTLVSLVAAGPALAGKKKKGASDAPGVPVTIRVVDAEEAPIAQATIRHPEEADPHRVNAMTGEFTTSVLYMPDGRELVFEKDLQLEFEISAAGYINQDIVYVVKKRKNSLTIIMQKMDLDLSDDDFDDPVIQFGRDKPIDGAGGEPAQ